MTLQFLDTFFDLPSEAPADHAHIIDLDSYKPAGDPSPTTVNLQDAVVTMLMHISELILKRFFGADKLEFRLIVNFTVTTSNDQLVIAKKGTDRGEEVLVSFHCNFVTSSCVSHH